MYIYTLYQSIKLSARLLLLISRIIEPTKNKPSGLLGAARGFHKSMLGLSLVCVARALQGLHQNTTEWMISV